MKDSEWLDNTKRLRTFIPDTGIGVARGETRGHAPPKFLENIVILCFERRFSKQNSVIRLKSNIFPPPKIFGLATPLDTGIHSPGMALPRTLWVRLNRLRIGVGRFRSCFHKWDMASSAACECGAEEQTVDHVVFQCPIHRPPHGLHSLTVQDDETIEWLLNTSPEI